MDRHRFPSGAWMSIRNLFERKTIKDVPVITPEMDTEPDFDIDEVPPSTNIADTIPNIHAIKKIPPTDTVPTRDAMDKKNQTPRALADNFGIISLTGKDLGVPGQENLQFTELVEQIPCKDIKSAMERIVVFNENGQVTHRFYVNAVKEKVIKKIAEKIFNTSHDDIVNNPSPEIDTISAMQVKNHLQRVENSPETIEEAIMAALMNEDIPAEEQAQVTHLVPFLNRSDRYSLISEHIQHNILGPDMALSAPVRKLLEHLEQLSEGQIILHAEEKAA